MMIQSELSLNYRDKLKRLSYIALLFSIILWWLGLPSAETNVQDIENQIQKFQKQMKELNATMKAQKV